MGTIASQEVPESATPSEEGGARAEILCAARRLAEREGVIELTLTAVAKEARVAPSDIYAFFTSKNDLLQAVVADDLANLAKTMRQSLERQPDAVEAVAPENAGTVSPVLVAPSSGNPGEAAPPAQDTMPEATQVPSMQAAETPHAEQQSATQAPARAEEMPRRFPVVQARRDAPRPAPEADPAASAAISRLQEQVAKLETRPVDQWLERRLRELERSLEGLHQVRSERLASSEAVELKQQELRDSIEALHMRHSMSADEAARTTNERFDAFDRQLRQTLSDLQAESVHLARRITALENLAFAARPDMMMAAAPFETAPAAPVPAPQEHQELQEQIATAADTPSGNGNAGQSYLAAARASAQAAAKAIEELPEKPVAKKSNKVLLYGACGSFGLFVVLLVGAGLMLRNASMTPVSAHASVRAVPMRAAATPVRAAAMQTRAAAAPVHAAAMQTRSAATPVRATAATALPRVAAKAAPVVHTAAEPDVLKLAQAGDPSAELLVGLASLDGKGVPKNEMAAVDWLSRSAAKGQPVAQYDLGALYADGRGVHADPVQAFQWFGAAALRGNRRAMHFLAIAYAEGIGTAKNLPEAARWFERAASLGAVNSQFNLAILYERGLGVAQSLPTAYKWYAIAAAQGDRESRARVTALTATMNPGDLASAKSAADSFKPEPLDPAANFPPKTPS